MTDDQEATRPRMCTKCGKPKSTPADVEAWAKRPGCYEMGDLCPCPLCTSICWMRKDEWCDGPDGPAKSAVISPCCRYRYSLTRRWLPGGSSALWVMLNPSTADAEVDDPTIRRVVAFSRRWGHHAVEVVNLFAHRASDPQTLRNVNDPIGPDCDDYIRRALSGASEVIVAWGAIHKEHLQRVAAVYGLLRQGSTRVRCLGVTKDGHPRHPLYLRSDQQREQYDHRSAPAEADGEVLDGAASG